MNVKIHQYILKSQDNQDHFISLLVRVKYREIHLPGLTYL